MPWLLDTNILIHASESHPRVLQGIVRRDGAVVTSALCFAELKRGSRRNPTLAASAQVRIELLLERIPIVPFDAKAADCYGKIIAVCGWSRARDFDRMIAGHAQAIGAMLVTDNLADFRDIPGLVLENWTT